MKLSRTVTYAVQATLQLAAAEPGRSIPCSRLAQEGQMPERFLLQILRTLVNRGILRSARGVDGGYRLQREPAEISLLEVIEAIEGPLSPSLPSAHAFDGEAAAKLRAAMDNVVARARRDLEAIKLAHLLPGPRG